MPNNPPTRTCPLETVKNALLDIYHGERTPVVALRYHLNVRSLYFQWKEDRERHHIIPKVDFDEIQVIRALADEDRRASAISRWQDFRDDALDRAIGSMPHVPIIDAQDIRNVVLSAAIATDKAAGLAGEPIGRYAVDHKHSGRVDHRHVVVHVPIYTPEQYDALTKECELAAHAVITPEHATTENDAAGHPETGENGDTPT